MDKVFVDTNIILDWLGKREPFYQYAKALFSLAEERKAEVLISTMSFITTEYILRKQLGKERAKRAIAGLRTISSVCDCGSSEIDLSLVSEMDDFEDAFQYYIAINNGATVLITRNLKDFVQSRIPIMDPEAYIKNYGHEQNVG